MESRRYPDAAGDDGDPAAQVGCLEAVAQRTRQSQILTRLQVRQHLGPFAADLVEEAERPWTDIMDTDRP
jgi:hypothetical protein